MESDIAPHRGAHQRNTPATPALDTGDKIKPDRRSAAGTVVESSLTPSTWEIFPAASPAQFFVVSHSSCPILTDQLGRAPVRTPVTNAHLVCRLLLDKKNYTIMLKQFK